MLLRVGVTRAQVERHIGVYQIDVVAVGDDRLRHADATAKRAHELKVGPVIAELIDAARVDDASRERRAIPLHNRLHAETVHVDGARARVGGHDLASEIHARKVCGVG